MPIHVNSVILSKNSGFFRVFCGSSASLRRCGEKHDEDEDEDEEYEDEDEDDFGRPTHHSSLYLYLVRNAGRGHDSMMLFGQAAKQREVSPAVGGKISFTQWTAGFSLAVWLLMVTAEMCPSLHAWLHGGAVPDNDNCAVVLITHGQMASAVSAAPVVVPVMGIEVVSRIEFSVFRSAIIPLPDNRGPPAASLVA